MTGSADDPLTWYLREISSVKPLAEAEEADLLQHVRTRDDQASSAERRLIEAKLALVVTIAERYSSARNSVLDLVESGNQGLLAALRTFREGSGESFTTHVTTCIEEAISKAVSEANSRSE